MDNTTVVTSEHSYCGGLADRFNPGTTSSAKSKTSSRGYTYACAFLVRFIFGSIIVLSAAAMVVLPFVLNFFGHANIEIECSADCEVSLAL
jgi:hypothetical protein